MKWFCVRCTMVLRSILLLLAFADNFQLRSSDGFLIRQRLIIQSIKKEMNFNFPAALDPLFDIDDLTENLIPDDEEFSSAPEIMIRHGHEINITATMEHWVDDLSERPSIQEVALQLDEDTNLPSSKYVVARLRYTEPSPLCPTKEGRHGDTEKKVFSAIVRILNFYEAHLDKILKTDTALALIILQDIDDKHGRILQRHFPLTDWIQQYCVSLAERLGQDGELCRTIHDEWEEVKPRASSYWKSPSVLRHRLKLMKAKELEKIGHEREDMWRLIFGQCQAALVNRGDVPFLCEEILLDPIPRTQYLLTHQLLHRMLIDRIDCPSITKLFPTKAKTYDSLCAKIFLEANYLDMLDIPVVFRDLFVEQVGLCGRMGYSNFLRADWLDKILVWQSKSDNGCFVKDPLSPADLRVRERVIRRRATRTESEQGLAPTEKCMPHFTAVSMIALSAYWDYLKDHCH